MLGRNEQGSLPGEVAVVCVHATEKAFYEEVDFKRDQKVEESAWGGGRGGRCGEGKSDREGWLRPGRMSH